MKLDKRIKALTDIQSVTNGCHDWQFMTKKGYFSDCIAAFEDLKLCIYAEYIGYREQEYCFQYLVEKDGKDYTHYAKYFIPEDSLSPEEPEKKYRPYKNIQELFEDIGVYIGDFIHFRSKAKETESHALITSYTTLKNGTEKICLGGAYYYTMQALFDLFELRSRGEWQPFGIEVKEE